MLRLTHFAVGHAAGTLGATAALTLFFVIGVGRLPLRTDGAALRPADHPVVVQSAADRIAFHQPDRVVLLVQSRPDGPSLDSTAGVRHLAALCAAIDQVPGVLSGRILSLTSVPDLRIDDTSIRLRRLGDVADGGGSLEEQIRRIRALPITDGLLLSRDGRSAAIYVPLAEGGDLRARIHALRAWARAHEGDSFRLRVTGPALAESLLGEKILADLSTLVPVMVLVMSLVVVATLRCAGALVVCLGEVAVVLIWTIGAMGWCGVPLTLVTTLLPVVLIAMATTDEIHLLERLQWQLRSDPGAAPAEPIRRALAEIERPVVLTSLTTAAGLLSFLSTSIAPLRHFGVFAALGIVLAMLLTFTAIPALISLLPRRWLVPRGRRASARRPAPDERLILGLGRGRLGIACALLVLALPGLLELEVNDTWLENLDPRSEIVRAEADFNRAFWGSFGFDIVLEAQPGFFYSPEAVALAERVRTLALAGAGVAGGLSYLDPLQAIVRAESQRGLLGSPSGERIGDLTALALLAGDPLDAAEWIRPDGSAVRFGLFLKSADYRRDRFLMDGYERELPEILAGTGVEARFGGDIPVGQVMVREIVRSQLRSVGLTLLVVSAILWVAGRGRIESLVVVIPVLSGTLLVFGGMGYAGAPLGVATSMFGALAIGVGVDFGIHFSHALRTFEARGVGAEDALRRTLRHTGSAIRWNALTLGLGFAVLGASALRPNRALGLLLAAGIFACYAATFLFLPDLLRSPRRR